jgi:hypothetical protein
MSNILAISGSIQNRSAIGERIARFVSAQESLASSHCLLGLNSTTDRAASLDRITSALSTRDSISGAHRALGIDGLPERKASFERVSREFSARDSMAGAHRALGIDGLPERMASFERVSTAERQGNAQRPCSLAFGRAAERSLKFESATRTIAESSHAKAEVDWSPIAFVKHNEMVSVQHHFDLNRAEIVLPRKIKIASLTRHVLLLVTQCNEASKTSDSSSDIFKPTTKMLIAFNELPCIVSSDRQRFGDMIDCLYFIFYEGAGADRLRFLDEFGGPLSKDECDFIWCVKHLRNKWSRHDADHGKEREIEKSWSELAAKFRLLELSVHPTKSKHFQKLHRQLLLLAEQFLNSILDGLQLKSTSDRAPQLPARTSRASRIDSR